MQAVIMAGGFGTRLRPLTNNIPKPMVPIANKPILEHIINLLKTHNIKNYVVLLFFMPEVIKEELGDGSKYGVKIQYVVPDQDYGTAGAVKLAEEYIKDKFVVISGDVLTDFNLTEISNFHKKKKTIATLALYRSNNPLQFGIVLTDKNDRIVRFLEKPSSSEVFSDTINTGIYFFNKEIFKHIPEGENYDFSKDLFPSLLNNKIPLYGHKTDGYWRDVGNLDEYIDANMDVLKGKLSYIRATGKDGNCISKNSKVDKDAIIENSIIGDNVIVEKDVIIRNSVLWKNIRVSSDSRLLFDVVGSNCYIGKGTRINDYVFIGENCNIGNNVFISSSLKIWDSKQIENNQKVTRSLIYDDRFFTDLFTDSRITGLSNLQINPEFGAKLGSVYGAFIGQGKNVIVARDSDYISNMIKRSITSGLMSAGVNVIDSQVIPIPMLRQELKSGEGSGGIFVRKSPFDGRSSDIIFFDKDGKDLSGNKTKSIERLFFSEEYKRADFEKVGFIKFQERTNEKYTKHFLSCLDLPAIRKNRFNIVIDYSYGIASTIFPNILGEFDCDVVSLSAHLDSKKVTRPLEEYHSSQEHFTFVVKSLKYDFGFMIDAGGEKIWMSTAAGKLLEGDRFLVIVLKMFLMVTKDVKKIAVPVQATGEIDIVAKEFGVEVVRVKNTHYSMMMACDDTDVKFVGGTRGGFLFPEFLYATDGIFSVAKIIELIARSGVSIDELDKNTPGLFLLKENIICSKEDKGSIMRKFMEDNTKYRQELIDGVKIFIDKNTTVLCIPDTDRNFIHLNVESDKQQKAVKYMKEYKKKIEKYLTQNDLT
ncbi:MAG: NTP transferase domain-containing protein [Ignavibacteria bacterium]|nr:NTP transferase domain-containing protein [Ignavibacteria bacterium]